MRRSSVQKESEGKNTIAASSFAAALFNFPCLLGEVTPAHQD
jgi:hypothetical protein